MNEPPFVSICIPAYKRIDYLQKLLDSIAIQSYKDYEVVITDDSPNEEVENFVKDFHAIKNIRFYKNGKALGTPENWNESIRNAQGTWIKLMHDDDWFTDENALQIFYEATLKTNAQFIFSAYNNVQQNSGTKESVCLSWMSKFLLKRSPLNLFKKQFVGNPSCTLIKRDMDIFYDKNFQWVVDFEYYIRCLQKNSNFFYIDKTLVNVGLNDEQVTNYSFRVLEIEMPENHALLEKLGINILKNIFVYDYYWRLYRNLEIRNIKGIEKYFDHPIHPALKQMISCQKKLKPALLKIGIFSKSLMLLNYLFYRP